MAINQLGIQLLADDLVMNTEMYRQDVFVTRDECGTACCMAGLCLLRKVGADQFYARFGFRLIYPPSLTAQFAEAAEAAGREQLGLNSKNFPRIFMAAAQWPTDLAVRFREARPSRAKQALIALHALQRTYGDGSIDHEPKEVLNPLPNHIAIMEERIYGPKSAQEEMDAMFTKARADLAAGNVYDLAELR